MFSYKFNHSHTLELAKTDSWGVLRTLFITQKYNINCYAPNIFLKMMGSANLIPLQADVSVAFYNKL